MGILIELYLTVDDHFTANGFHPRLFTFETDFLYPLRSKLKPKLLADSVPGHKSRHSMAARLCFSSFYFYQFRRQWPVTSQFVNAANRMCATCVLCVCVRTPDSIDRSTPNECEHCFISRMLEMPIR